jgi:hypothetical protein
MVLIGGAVTNAAQSETKTLMPEGFSKKELKRPPSPARLDQADREMRALEVWHESVGNIAA